MQLLHASAEVRPFAMTGGLADVLGALPPAQAKAGHAVLVVMPWYAGLSGGDPYWIGDVDVPFAGASLTVGVGTMEQAGVRYAFVGHEDFRRPRLYGYGDDVRRFCLFSRAVPVVAERLGFDADLLHLHDWHSAALAPLLRFGALLPSGYSGLPTVLTVHNAQYQGWGDAAAIVHWLRLPAACTEVLSHGDHGNLLHAGLMAAEQVTTVSPSYADELREQGAYGLEADFRALGERFGGVLNGLDELAFDPASDPLLAAPFDSTDLDGKAACKLALTTATGLTADAPLLGVVSRLAEQKGIDLLLDALPDLLAQGWNLVLLGTGEARLEARVAEAMAQYPGRVAGRLGFDDGFARQVYAAADVLAIPSRFEPCGLTQMIAMRYGALPVARATGGLIDTIDDGHDGFLFEEATPGALTGAMAMARATYDSPARWLVMQQAAMHRRFGWDLAVAAYDRIYRRTRPGGTP